MCNESAEKIYWSTLNGVKSRFFFSRSECYGHPVRLKLKFHRNSVYAECGSLVNSTQDLQKRFRVLESENKVFIEKAESTIIHFARALTALGEKRRQLSTLDSLSKENAELSRVIAAHQSIPRDVEYKLSCDKENAAIEERKQVISNMECEKERSVELDATEDLLRQRLARVKGVARQSLTHDSIAKYMNILEKRLDRSIVRFNEILHQNSVLRNEVDNLRRETRTNDEIKNRLLSDISNFKRIADQVIEETSAAYCAKEKATTDTNNLRMIADREYTEFQAEWKELNHLLEKDKKMFETIRSQQVVTSYVRAHVPAVLEDTPPVEEQSVVSEPIPLSVYEQYFERIKQATGVVSVDEFISTLTRREIKNFSLFNRLNDLKNQIDSLTDRIEVCQTSINDSRPITITNHLGYTPLPDVYSESIKLVLFQISRLQETFESICDLLGIPRQLEMFKDPSVTIHQQLSMIGTSVDDLVEKYLGIFGTARPQKTSVPNRRFFARSNFSDSRRIGLSSLPSSIALSDQKEDSSNPSPLFRSVIVSTLSAAATPAVSRPLTASSTKASSTHAVRKRVKN